MARQLEIRAHGGAEEQSGRSRANPAEELGKRFLRCTNVALSVLALSGPAAVAGVAAGTAIMAQAREAKAQDVGMRTIAIGEVMASIQEARGYSTRTNTALDGEFYTSVTIPMEDGGRVLIGANVYCQSTTTTGTIDIQYFHPDGSRGDGVALAIDSLAATYQETAGEQLRYVRIGVRVDEAAGIVRGFIIPVEEVGGIPREGGPMFGVGYLVDRGRVGSGGTLTIASR